MQKGGHIDVQSPNLCADFRCSGILRRRGRVVGIVIKQGGGCA
jgi:hypothetical protein